MLVDLEFLVGEYRAAVNLHKVPNDGTRAWIERVNSAADRLRVLASDIRALDPTAERFAALLREPSAAPWAAHHILELFESRSAPVEAEALRVIEAVDERRRDGSGKPYDEDVVLTRYIWDHYQHLMTRAEQLGGRAAAFNEKADGYSPSRVADRLRHMASALGDDPSVAAFLDVPVAEFRKHVCDRLLAEHAAAIDLNRCPKCGRIPRSPQARQCPWCFQSWRDVS